MYKTKKDLEKEVKELKETVLKNNQQKELIQEKLTEIVEDNCSEAENIIKDFCDYTGIQFPRKKVHIIVDVESTVDIDYLEISDKHGDTIEIESWHEE